MASQFPPEPPTGLLGRVRAGDDRAFAELYRMYAGRAYTLVLRMLDRRETAEEVLQEVFMDLPRALPGFRGDGPFWGWLRWCGCMTSRVGHTRRSPTPWARR